MPTRLGPGPVFVYEWLTTSRRWQLYALRAGFVGAILLGMVFVWNNELARSARAETASIRDLARFGESMYRAIASIELSLILLAAPAATAGAVCLDKARGTLDHMLVTDLSDAEIVLGKLGVRLIPVLGLVACTLPVLALSALLGGIDPLALLGLFLAAIGCAFVGCSLAMVLSVYGRKTHEVVMMAYVIILFWVMMPAFVEILHMASGGVLVSPSARTGLGWALLEWSNPYVLTSAPYDTPGRVGVVYYLGFLAISLLLSTALVALATGRIRRVALSQAGRPAVGSRPWLPGLRRLPRLPRLPGPTLEGNPVAWREWHRSRPSRMMRVAWGLYTALGLLWLVLAAATAGNGPMANSSVGVMNMIQVSIGLLLLSVGAATSLAEERVRGSLDVLLTTPISTRSILAGKWWGGFRRIGSVAIWPAATTLPLALNSGYWVPYVLLLGLVLAYGAAITSLGLVVATWVSRVGRAIALCVTIFVLCVIGWPLLVVLFLGGGDQLAMQLVIGDPPYGAAFLTFAVHDSNMRIAGGGSFQDLILGAFLWIPVYLIGTATVYMAALGSFDRCLGRMPEDGAPAPARWRMRPTSPAPDRLAAVLSSSEGDPEERS
jgi:ABC-type transport system involved in multi-copper enzyme maturation permease subunit